MSASQGRSAIVPQGAQPADDERTAKRGVVLAILAAEPGMEGVVLTSGGVLSWYLAGARVHVSLAGDPVLAVVVTPECDTVVIGSSEVDRLCLEELPPDVAIRALPWDVTAGQAIARDSRPLLWESDIGDLLRAERAALHPVERERFAVLSREVAAATTRVLAGSGRHDTERAIAARLGQALVGIGADPLVTLVAGRERLGFRHPLPTLGELGTLAMVVVCARRHGLITNLSRWVGEGRADPQEDDARARILDVEADFFDATRPGVVLGDAFATAVSGYARRGFAADEWRNHHQGGPAGYFGRDPRATLHSTDTIRAGQAFAWNPSARLAKVEDTVIIDVGGPSVLTDDPAWPTTQVRGRARPDVLWR